MKLIPITVAFLGLASAACAKDDAFKVEPIVVRPEDGSKTTVGLSYDFYRTLAHSDGTGVGDTVINLEKPVKQIQVTLEGKGLITTSAKDNPENLLKTTFKAEGFYQSGAKRADGGGLANRIWSVSAGGFASLESDQSFDDQQTILGFEAAFATSGVVTIDKDDFGIEFHYGEVEPGDDMARKTALGTTTLKNYDRFSLEANYQVQTSIALVPDIEFNYRWFRERHAPRAIKAAKLDEFELFTVRFGLPADLFVAYSDGKLPFDRQNDRTFKAGFSYELGELGQKLGQLGKLLEGFSN